MNNSSYVLNKINEKKYVLIFILINLVSIFLRLYRFPFIPMGLGQDEADSAYEAFSIIHTGMDKWGYKLPVYFLSWGSGQNALQTYLQIPFIEFFGLNLFGVRILPLILGILTIPLLFILIKRVYQDTSAALLGSFLLSINPWHIMISRWSLESNILPFFLLLSLTLYISAKESKHKNLLIIFSFISFSLSLYAYAISIVILPFLIMLLLIVNREFVVNNLKIHLIGLLIFSTLTLPIGVFFLQNFVIHKQLFESSIFSIPLLPSSRLEQNNGFNIYENILFLLTGVSRGSIWNYVQGFILLGIITVPLAIMEILRLFWKKKTENIFLIWCVTSLPLLFITVADVNRENSFYIPIIALSAGAVMYFVNLIANKKLRIMFIIIFIAINSFYTLSFIQIYFKDYNLLSRYAFNNGLADAFNVVKKLNNDSIPVYVSHSINLNYAYTLYYLKADSRDFRKHSNYRIINGSYKVRNYRNYFFDLYPDFDNYPFYYISAYPLQCLNNSILQIKGIFKVGKCDSI